MQSFILFPSIVNEYSKLVNYCARTEKADEPERIFLYDSKRNTYYAD